MTKLGQLDITHSVSIHEAIPLPVSGSHGMQACKNESCPPRLAFQWGKTGGKPGNVLTRDLKAITKSRPGNIAKDSAFVVSILSTKCVDRLKTG